MAHEESWLDRQYLPSLSVPNSSGIFERWRGRAAETRAKFKFKADLRYGPHDREVLDFYPAENAHGCLIFIHGGYWTEFSKRETSWVADGFVVQGISVALINYPLCPDVSIGAIGASCIAAFAHLYLSILSASERRGVVVTGHSAGGYLAAAHMAQNWKDLNLPADPIAGVIALSGVFDVTPLINTALNADLRITAHSARSLNLTTQMPRTKAQFTLAVGQHESAEFHRQSSALADHWRQLGPEVLDVAGANHFTIIDSLAIPGASLNRLAVAMARR